MGYNAGASKSGTAAADEEIKTKFKKGRMSAPEVQKTSALIADIVQSSGSGSSSSQGVSDWAKAGAGGKLEGSMSRDIISKMGRGSKSPQVYATPCVFWDPDANAQVVDDIYFQLAHETLDQEISDDRPLEEWVELDRSSSLMERRRNGWTL